MTGKKTTPAMVGWRQQRRLWLPEFYQHGVYRVERGVDLFADLACALTPVKTSEKENIYLRTSQHYLTRYEDEQNDLGLDHAVDKTGEQL